MTATAHDTAKIWGFATHELEPGDASLLKDHLGDCPECRDELLLVRSVRSLAVRAAEAIPVLDWSRIDSAVAALVESRTARTAGLASSSSRWHLLVVPFAVLGVAAVALASRGGPSMLPSTASAAAMVPSAPAEPQIPTLLEAQGCTRGKDSLKPGATLSAGDVVATGKAGFALVRLPDGSRLRLGENAQLKLLRFDDAGASASLERGRVAVQAERPLEVAAGGFKARGVATVFSVNSKTAGLEIASAKGRVHVERPGLLPMLVDTGRKAAFTWKSSAAKLTTVSSADQAEFDKVILAPSVMVAALQRSMTDLPLASLTPAEAEVAAAEWSSPGAARPAQLQPQPQPQAAPAVAVAVPQPLAMPPVEARPVAEPVATPIDEREFAAYPMSIPPETTKPAKPAKASRRASPAPVLVAVAEPVREVAAAPAPAPTANAQPDPTPIMIATSEPASEPAPAPVAPVAAPAEVVEPAPAVETPAMASMREALDSKRDLRIRSGMLIAELQPTPKDVLEVEYAKVQARRAAGDYAPLPAAAPAPAAPAAAAQPAPVAAAAVAAVQPAANADESAEEAEELFLLRAERSLRKANCQKFMSGLEEIASDSPATSKTERARITRARCLQAQGKAGQAQAEFQKYLRETPSGDYAAEARSNLAPAAAAQPRPPSALSDS